MTTVGMTRALGCGVGSNSTAQYSMFAFLYGTFPTAPSVFLYASQYGVGMDLVSILHCFIYPKPDLFTELEL